jgi:6-phosphogluconolactonase/glucosamine-6-phosphate isomerase/deaminase
MRDFFISYNSKDKEWATWVAWQLEQAGYDVVFEEWDFAAGENFALLMHEASSNTEKTIAILSEHYLSAEYVHPEWAAAFAKDPLGKHNSLIPIRISNVKPQGLLSSIICIDLFGLDENEARDKLLFGIDFSRKKPKYSPKFPSAKPRFPKSFDQKNPITDKFQLIVCKSPEVVFKVAAQIFRSIVHNNITPSIILPTGRVASSLFRSLCECADKGEITDLSRSVLFIDTETFGVTANHSTSRHRFVRDSFLSEMARRKVKLPKEGKIFFFKGVYDCSDPCIEIDVALRKYPPHLHIVSVSPEGEVIGYEPGKYKSFQDLLYKKAEIIHLTEKAKNYIDDKQPARAILTIGFGNMLSAKKILLIIADRGKQRVLEKMITENSSPYFPVTLLRDHGDLTVLTDLSTAKNIIDASSRITIIEDVRDYFDIITRGV